jgi:RNA polymerase sigma-70 factor (ECF subfamily)
VIDFQTLYEAHAPAVHRFALFLSGNRAQAEDITSETFIRVWTAPDRVALATVRAYLLTIARNIYLQSLRRERRRAEMPQAVMDPAPGPHEEATGRQEAQVVLAALGQLPEVDRAALLMRAEDGLPYDQIAAALGLTETAARVKVHRARLKLAAARKAREEETCR